jgi:uncharacterized membrane protein (DUF2068 family)
MKDPVAVRAILQPHRRVRYLKLIAVFKMAKGALLFLLGFSLLFLNSRAAWLDRISDWADAEILLSHTRFVTFLLNSLQDALVGGKLRATGLLALFYCGILLTEGIGVYLQMRWAEFLMIFATSALIPFEVRHLWHHPSVTAVLILLANCFIVWFLYLVLKREKPEEPVNRPKQLIETR